MTFHIFFIRLTRTNPGWMVRDICRRRQIRIGSEQTIRKGSPIHLTLEKLGYLPGAPLADVLLEFSTSLKISIGMTDTLHTQDRKIANIVAFGDKI